MAEKTTAMGPRDELDSRSFDKELAGAQTKEEVLSAYLRLSGGEKRSDYWQILVGFQERVALRLLDLGESGIAMEFTQMAEARRVADAKNENLAGRLQDVLERAHIHQITSLLESVLEPKK